MPPFGVTTKQVEFDDENEVFRIEERDRLEAEHAARIERALNRQLNDLIPANATEEQLNSAETRVDETSEELYLAILALILMANRIGVDSGSLQIGVYGLGVDEAEALDTANAMAEQRAREAVNQINNTTRNRIARAVQAGGTVSFIRESLRPFFGERRAQSIARTETTGGVNAGIDAVGQNDGIEGYEWYTMEDERVCPICRPMHGAARPKDVPFYVVGGTIMPPPPAHPNCRCGEALVVS